MILDNIVHLHSSIL